jgi:GNAT superfamily N-acetyltransferase
VEKTVMSEPGSVELSILTRDDANVMWPWLREHLQSHLRWWSGAHGLAWDKATVEQRIDARRLVHREWAELESGAQDGLVRVARRDGQAVGVVYAELRHDRYLGMDIGVLSWIYVVPEARGSGLSRTLIDAAYAWMISQGVVSMELYVTAPNAVAVRFYERAGLQIVDHRMMGPIGSDE